MTFSKASRTSVLAAVLCLLLIGFAGVSYGSVRYDVNSSATEVINTGLAEVTGSLSFFPVGTANSTEESQIAVAYNANGTHMEIDNTADIDAGPDSTYGTGILLYTSGAFNGHVYIAGVSNIKQAGACFGQITIALTSGAAPSEAVADDWFRLEGVRGRIATSTAVTQGADLYAAVQSINNPDANTYQDNDTIYRVARSYPGLLMRSGATSLLLCFPTTGNAVYGDNPPPNGGAYIQVKEGFPRAFVATDYNGYYAVDPRLDDADAELGHPYNPTQIYVFLTGIPLSVAEVSFNGGVCNNGGPCNSFLELDDDAEFDDAGNAVAVYDYGSYDQTGWSDVNTESFNLTPGIYLYDPNAPPDAYDTTPNFTDVGDILARVALGPYVKTLSTRCDKPGSWDGPEQQDPDQPRFAYVPVSDDNPDNEYPGEADDYVPYAHIVRCNCYMLFSYVAAMEGFDTGIAVANTSQDTQAFDAPGTPPGRGIGASNQSGPITFYFYDKEAGYVGSFTTTDSVGFGKTYVGLLSQMLPEGVTEFTGYIIAKAQFQYCHAISYISDSAFATLAQGYAALIIPDPAIKTGHRTASAAADMYGFDGEPVLAGESLDN